ncbi:hypothetical protein DXG03_009279 [Asterophora parasitica]|uniref:MYND-type domain-containing protein n=1 Tax=Asterophora parasitica TaxID=117018 RepID=A0A9P7G509_9AGAR|nr:hypothetical protein DXG03_009279 [Asterophora parasitica]
MPRFLLPNFPAGSAPDNRKTIPWDELGDEVKLLVKRAADGSLEGLRVFVAWIELDKLTARQERIVPIVYRYLANDPPDDLTTEAGILSCNLASASLEGVLQTLLWQLTEEDIATCLSMKYLTRQWPTIWKWIQCLYTRIYSNQLFRESRQPPVEGTNDHRTVLAIRFLFVVLDPFPIFKTMLQTPEFIPVLIDVWFRLSETRSSPAQISQSWLRLTTHFQNTMTDQNTVALILEPFEGDMSRFAGLLLRNLRALTNKSFNFGGANILMGVLPVVHCLSSTSLLIPGLNEALLSRHSMIEVMRTLQFSLDAKVNQPLEHVPGYSVRSCVWGCLTYVETASRFTDGFTWITQAVRSKLIISLLKSVLLPKEPDDAIRNHPYLENALKHTSLEAIRQRFVTIVTIFSIFSIYRSFVRELERAMADPQIHILEAQLPRDGTLWESWEHFKSLLKERSTVKRAFDKTGKYSQECSAADCDQRETKSYFKICSACQSSVYCSKDCQARDWKSGRHRIYCDKLQKHRAEGISSPISEHDHQFIQYITEHYIREHRVSLARARSAVFIDSHYRSEDIVIYIEYAGPALGFVVDEPREFPPALYDALMARGPRAKRNSPEPLFFLVVDIPYGKTHQMSIFGADQADSPNFWVRRLLDETPCGGNHTTLVAHADEWFRDHSPFFTLAGAQSTPSIFDCPYDIDS